MTGTIRICRSGWIAFAERVRLHCRIAVIGQKVAGTIRLGVIQKVAGTFRYWRGGWVALAECDRRTSCIARKEGAPVT